MEKKKNLMDLFPHKKKRDTNYKQTIFFSKKIVRETEFILSLALLQANL